MMKKYRRILSLVIAMLLLTACGTVSPNPTENKQTSDTEESEYLPPFATRPVETYPDPATTEMNINCQYLPEIVDNPDNLPILKWVCLPAPTYGARYGSIWNETAAIEVNQMLEERNMPFRVQFVIYTTDYLYPDNMDWFARPEVQADIESADLLFVNSISAERAEDYYMPLTEYVSGNATPSLKNAVPHEINWQNSSVNGEVYGISQWVRQVSSGGWYVDSDVLSEYGLTLADFQKNYWEIDETLKKLNEASGKQKLIQISSTTMFGIVDPEIGIKSIYPGIAGLPMDGYFTGIGSIYVVDYVNDVPTIVNTLDTETTRKIKDAVLRYKEKYATPDDGSVDEKLYFSFVLCHQPVQKKYANADSAVWLIPVSIPSYNASESKNMLNCSGVSASSKHQKDAVSLLSLIAEDEEFRMRLMFGEEGRDYTIDAKGNYCVTKQEDGSRYNMCFLSPWSYFSGMEGGSYDGTEGYYPQYEGMTTLETYLEMIENAEPYYAVPFDFSGLQEELRAVEYTCQAYFYRFASLTEEKYAEMIEKINAAGGEKIMKELQKQLDEWVKNNPGKPVTPNRS